MSESPAAQLEPVSIVLFGLSAAAEVQARKAIPKTLGRQVRAMKMVDGGYDAEAHTVTLALSSDEPVNRGWCMEILSHKKGAVRTARMDNGIPLLFNHNMDDHLGVSLSYTITGGILRLVYQFGPSPMAKEKEADVAARILKDTSIGYAVYRWVTTEDAKGNITMEAVDWEPLEGSLVTVPADMTVGIGRAFGNEEYPVRLVKRKAKASADDDDEDDEFEDDDEQDDPDEDEGQRQISATSSTTIPAAKRTIMPPEQIPATPAAVPAAVVVAEPAMDNATRVATLRTLSTTYPDFFPAQRLKLAEDLGQSVETVQRSIFDASVEAAKRSDVPTISDEVFGGMTERDLSRYTLAGAYRSAVNMRTPGTFTGKQDGGFEREVGQDLLKTAGARGINDLGAGVPVPSYRTLARIQQRTIASGGNAGAASNFTTVNADPIELLRSATALLAMGATMMTGLHGKVQLTKQTAGGTSNWVTEGTAATNSDLALGFFTMQPNRLTMQNSYYRDFLAQSGVAIDSLMSADRLATLAHSLDNAGLIGSGIAPVPLGLMNQTGLAAIVSGATRAVNGGAVTAGPGAVPMTFVDWNNMEAAIATANGDISSMGIITTTRVRAAGRSTPKIPGTNSDFIWPTPANAGNGVQTGPLGLPSLATANTALTGFTANGATNCHAAIMGVFSQFLFADWGLGEVIADMYTGAGAAKYIITEHGYYDANVRHLESFAACTTIQPS